MRRLPPDRFEPLTDQLGWRCRMCGAEIAAHADRRQETEVNRLAEVAADHALFCGRCDD
jgi:ribosomal protein S27AE